MTVSSGKPIKPMLIGLEREPFDDSDYLYELKLDGVRCIAYLDKGSTRFYTRNGIDASEKYPEMMQLYHQVKEPCVLDGELVVLRDDAPDFGLIKSRTLTKNVQTIERYAVEYPATLVVFDLLYAGAESMMSHPLTRRRELLEEYVSENAQLVVSRAVDTDGVSFFERVKEQGLEGLIAKRKDSLYHPGKRTKEWCKIKNQLDDDFIICGYLPSKDDTVVSLVLAQHDEQGALHYMGRVTLGMKNPDFKKIDALKRVSRPTFANEVPASNNEVIWVERKLVCKVIYIQRTDTGALRHPIYQELRFDKTPEDTVMQLA